LRLIINHLRLLGTKKKHSQRNVSYDAIQFLPRDAAQSNVSYMLLRCVRLSVCVSIGYR